MRVREVLLFLLVSVLMASIVVGALVIREGRPPVLPDDSAGEPWSPRLTGAIGIKADRSPGTGPSEAYAGGPGQIVLEWTSDVTGAVRWQYRLLERFGEIWDPPTGREVWGEWTDVPGSDGDTNRIRVGGLREVTLYVVEVRPLIGNGARSAATVGEPVAIGSARTLFVGDDGIPWLRVNDRVGGGGTFRIGGTDYVIELPRGMVMNPSIHDERFEDERFSSRIAHFEALLRDSVTDSYLVMNSGEYVRRVIAWHGARGSDEASTAAARRVNEWFDAIVGSTRLFPRQGVGPAPFFRFPICRSGEAVADPHRNPGLASDCYVLLGGWAELLKWDQETRISQWDGVTLGGTPPRVERLDLRSRGLRGGLASRWRLLTGLTYLDLRDNQLDGALSPDLGPFRNLEVLLVGGNPGLTGCIPASLRAVPTNDLDSLELPDCDASAEVDTRVTLGDEWTDQEALSPTLAVGESAWLHVVLRRATWAPVTVEFRPSARGRLEVEPDIVQFALGTADARTVRLTGIRPSEDIEIQVRIKSDGDREYDEIDEPTVMVSVSPTRLRALVTEGGEVVLEWDTTARGVERWEYRQKQERGEWRAWTTVPESDGASRRYRVAGLSEHYSFEVRPWVRVPPARQAVPGIPSNASDVSVAKTGLSGSRDLWRGEVEGGRRYWMFGYSILAPADMRLRLGTVVINGDGARRLFDANSGSWIWFDSAGEFSGRRIISPEVPGTPGSIASMHALREVNALFDQIVDSLR